MAETLHVVGEDFRTTVSRILSRVGFPTVLTRHPFPCGDRENHSTRSNHVVDILTSYKSSDGYAKGLIVESKRSVGSSEQLCDEVESLANKSHCLYRQVPFVRNLGPIRKGLIITAENLGPNRLQVINEKSETVQANKDVKILCIHGPRFRILHSMAECVNRSVNQNILRLFPFSLEPSRVLMSSPLTPEWLMRNETSYFVTVSDGTGTINIFDMKESYNLEDWNRDSSFAVRLGWAIDRVETLGGFTDDLLDDAGQLPIPIPFVNHKLRRTHFCSHWDYAVVNPR